MTLSRSSQSKRAVVLLLALALLAGLLALSPQTAAADNVQLSVTKTSDGEDGSLYNLDDDTSNGEVANNSLVTWNWELSLTATDAVTFTQTLPDCWGWNTDSLGVFNTSTQGGLTSSYAVTGSTLVVTMSSPDSLANVDFSGVSAGPKSGCAPNDVYEPVIQINDDATESTVTLDPITAVSEHRIEFYKRNIMSGNQSRIHGTQDFGSGPEAATGVRFQMYFTTPSAPSNIGMNNTKLDEPLTVTDQLTLPTGVTRWLIDSNSISNYPIKATLTESNLATNTATFSVADLPTFPTSGSAYFYYIVWLPDSELPAYDKDPVTLSGTASATMTAGGEPVLDPNGNNQTATGSYLAAPGFGANSTWRWDKMSAVWAGEGEPVYGVHPDYSNGWNMDSWVAPGGSFQSMLRFAPTYTNGRTPELPSLRMYDFWDPTKQQLVENPEFWVGQAGGEALPDGVIGDMKVSYTNNGTKDTAETTTEWFDSIEEAGGVEAVNGIRFEFTDVQLPDAPTDSSYNLRYLKVAIPFTVVANDGVDTRNVALVKGGPASAPNTYNRSDDATFKVRDTRLFIWKSPEDSSVSTGGTITYQIRAGAAQTLGGDSEVHGLTVVDEVGPGFQSIDVSGLDPAWTAEITGDPRGWTIRFTYNGVAKTNQTLPLIVYQAKAMYKAPETGQVLSTANVSAIGNTAALAERYANKVVSVNQTKLSEVVKTIESDNPMRIGQDKLVWNINWFNYKAEDQKSTVIYDIIPRDGDSRGNSFAATLALSGLDLYGDAQTDATLAVTTDDSVTSDNLTTVTWQEDLDQVDLNQVTAVRVSLPGMSPDYDGGLRLTADVSGLTGDDVVLNDAIRYIEGDYAGKTNTVAATVNSSAVAGVVWRDDNADGLRDDAEPLLAGAEITLTRIADGGEETVAMVMTDDNGEYSFADLPGGTYRIRVASGLAHSEFTIQDAGSSDDIDSDVNAEGEYEFVLGDSADVTFDAGVRGLVELQLQKTLSGAEGADNREAEFGYEVSCTFNGDAVELDAGSGTITAGDPLVVGLAPLGSDCVFTETDAGGADGTTVNGEEGATLGLTSIQEDTLVRFDNRFDAGVVAVEAGSLTVSKVVAGEEPAADQSYQFEAACTYEGEPVELGDQSSFELADGESVKLIGMAVGSKCVVTETDSGEADEVRYDGEVAEAAEVTVGAQSELQVTNQFDEPKLLPFLPNTGGNVLALSVLALLLVGAGIAVVVVSRRRARA